jgi:hypothetical protein
MHTLIPFLDLDPYNIEPLRLLINSNNIGEVADAFPTEKRFEMYLRCMKYRDAVVGNCINNNIGINCHPEV